MARLQELSLPTNSTEAERNCRGLESEAELERRLVIALHTGVCGCLHQIHKAVSNPESLPSNPCS